MKEVVGAIWRLDSYYSERINSSWTDGLFVFISKSADVWCGFIPSVALGMDVPGIGDVMPSLGTVPIGIELTNEWELVRQDLLNNRLPQPVEGKNPLVNKPPATNVCTCGYYYFLRNGCPSNRGLPCPGIPDEKE